MPPLVEILCSPPLSPLSSLAHQVSVDDARRRRPAPRAPLRRECPARRAGRAGRGEGMGGQHVAVGRQRERPRASREGPREPEEGIWRNVVGRKKTTPVFFRGPPTPATVSVLRRMKKMKVYEEKRAHIKERKNKQPPHRAPPRSRCFHTNHPLPIHSSLSQFVRDPM